MPSSRCLSCQKIKNNGGEIHNTTVRGSEMSLSSLLLCWPSTPNSSRRVHNIIICNMLWCCSCTPRIPRRRDDVLCSVRCSRRGPTIWVSSPPLLTKYQQLNYLKKGSEWDQVHYLCNEFPSTPSDINSAVKWSDKVWEENLCGRFPWSLPSRGNFITRF